MSRSGYSEDGDGENLIGLWRANVDRALGGKRGQAFLREMAMALDSMAIKELVADEVVRDSAHVCAMGAVAVARGLDVSILDVEDGKAVGHRLGIARAMACEIAHLNDERGRTFNPHTQRWRDETPAERWRRMRLWVTQNTRVAAQ